MLVLVYYISVMALTNTNTTHAGLRVIGHRGAKGLAPENTRESFDAALTNNVDEIEFDVRITKDGVAVIAHGTALTLGGKSYPIKTGNFAELHALFPHLLTLDQALTQLKNTKPLIIEIKPGEPLQPVLSAVKTALANGQKESLLSFASFDFKILKVLRESLPKAELIVNERWSGVRASHRARSIGATRLSMNQRWLWSGFIHSMSQGGFKLAAYTLNNPKKAQRWERAGLAAVITDFPDRFTTDAD